MKKINQIVSLMRYNPKNISFNNLVQVCDYYFGDSRQSGSHIIYKMPWFGDPRINIQCSGKNAKSYQVKQVLLAIDKLMEEQYEK